MKQAARRFDEEHRTGRLPVGFGPQDPADRYDAGDRDLIGSEYGYHCEKCFKTLDYGEEVNEDGHILCKDCAKKDD